MISAYLIFVTYAFLGYIYAPGWDSFLALISIFFSCLPILIAGVFEKKSPIIISRKPSEFVYWGLFVLGLFNLVLITHSVNKEILDLFSVHGFISIAGDSTSRRYTGGGGSGNPVVLSFSLLLLYLIGAVEKEVSGWKKLFAFLPVMLYTALSTEKWPLFLGGVFFLAGIFISNSTRTALSRVLKYVIGFCVFGFAVIGLSLVLRGFEGSIIEGLYLMLHYLFAPYSALGYWLHNNAVEQCCTLGALTFIGPLDAIGLTVREAGVYANTYSIYGLETNIYTAFRYLVQDFSILGPFVFCMILSGLYSVAKFNGYERMSVVIRGFVIFCALLSVAVTPFVHNSVLLAICLALLYGYLTQRYKLNTGFPCVTNYYAFLRRG